MLELPIEGSRPAPAAESNSKGYSALNSQPSLWQSLFWMGPIAVLPVVNLLVFSGWHLHSIRASFSNRSPTGVPIQRLRFLGLGTAWWLGAAVYGALAALVLWMLSPTLRNLVGRLLETTPALWSGFSWEVFLATFESARLLWTEDPWLAVQFSELMVRGLLPHIGLLAAMSVGLWFLLRLLSVRYARSGSLWALADLRGAIWDLRSNPRQHVESFLLNFLVSLGLAGTLLVLPGLLFLSLFVNIASWQGFLAVWGTLDGVAILSLGTTLLIAALLLAFRFFCAVEVDSRYVGDLAAHRSSP